jgi:N-acyl-D-aspartate/D-glutamate deacylase
VLGEFVREDRVLGLEDAVHRMTGLAADRLGLQGRGRIRDGLAADLVVFDPASVRSLATYDDPRRFPVGIPYVIVNGVLVVDDGRHTGATPGRVLRRGAA